MDANDLEANPSAVSEPTSDEQGATPADIDADSSPASEGAKADLLKMVRDVRTGDAEKPGPESPTGEQARDESAPGAEAASDTKPKEPDDENFSDVPFHTHPRFRQVIAQRDRFKEGHEQFGKVQEYLRENGLSAQDAGQALRFAALMKRDPEAAWREMKPVVQDLLTRAGEILPDDLRKQVSDGELTRNAALEISRLRAGRTAQTNQAEIDAQAAQARQLQESQQAAMVAAERWEAEHAVRDPDFEKKAGLIAERVAYLQRVQGVPGTPEGVRGMLDQALTDVNDRLRQHRPAIQPIRGGLGVRGDTAQEAPRTIAEMVRRGG